MGKRLERNKNIANSVVWICRARRAWMPTHMYLDCSYTHTHALTRVPTMNSVLWLTTSWEEVQISNCPGTDSGGLDLFELLIFNQQHSLHLLWSLISKVLYIQHTNTIHTNCLVIFHVKHGSLSSKTLVILPAIMHKAKTFLKYYQKSKKKVVFSFSTKKITINIYYHTDNRLEILAMIKLFKLETFFHSY